ncbi:meiotic recombination protein REC8 homolog [Embiotoca jacksoni]|uniref:meiotic recombination protein REC8 homolog n=1 Tax=Embiotoca jacksoni TaxID=100190 RepID=UPI00370413A9
MFYYPTVLKRHTGCFSTIWLVATKGIKVPRREFLKVNVQNTCDDIMNYLLERIPPPRPGLPRPRFSLYLSSQLQYGVIVVYHQQCTILLEELYSVVGQLHKKWRKSQKIDMDDHSRQAQVLPDALSLLEEAEGAPDPLFGAMYVQDAIPSPTTLVQLAENTGMTMSWELREASPEHPELRSPAAAAAAAAAATEGGITASPESITLRETEPVTIPTPEFEGAELADEHLDIIDFLLAETDDFPEEDLERPREEVTAGEQERKIEREEGEEVTALEPEREIEREEGEEVTALEQEREIKREEGEEVTALEQEREIKREEGEEVTALEQEREIEREEGEEVIALEQERGIEREEGEEVTALEQEREIEREEGEEVIALEQEREIEREEGEEDLEKDRKKEITGSTLELQPTTVSSEDATLLPQEEPGQAVEEAKPPIDQLTPVSVPGIPSPPTAARERERSPRSVELENVPPPEKRRRIRRRRRQLIFYDPETQIRQEELQQQINDPLVETRCPPVHLPSSQRSHPAAALFNNPCSFLPEEVQFLWRQAATITPVLSMNLWVVERGPESTDSEREREMMEVAQTEVGRVELSPKEVPRQVTESEMYEFSAEDILTLEGSDQKEPSREISPIWTSDREVSPVSKPVSIMTDIPEVADELLGKEVAESPGLVPEVAEHEVAPVPVQSLLPPEADRKTVSDMFLKLRAEDILTLEGSDQKEPSREISPIWTSDREVSPVSKPVSIMTDIPEVGDELLGKEVAESPGLVPEVAEHEVAPVPFQSLLPPEADRKTVSNMFLKLLENLSSRKLQVEQDEPYGDILISPGSNLDEA